jgi:hypothetical protein
MIRVWVLPGLLAVLVWAVSGCGGHKAVYPVRGKVLDSEGKPLARATVIFCPAENVYDNANKPAGFADDQGVFTLTTYSPSDGAPAGEYVVTVEWRAGPRDPKKPRHAPPDRLGGKFSDPGRSPLKVTVVKGDNDIEIKLP